MPSVKRIYNILRFGLGEQARVRKRAHKAKRRAATFDSELWKRDEQFAQRSYSSYDEYVEHQGSKLDKIIHRLRETEAEDFADFKHRFETCKQLSEARSVLCLGARIGTEVRALHSLGYFAVGIDLNPGQDNPYVLPGDFHNIVFPEGSVDAVYTNTLDHVFDLEKMTGEIRRLLRPNGIFIADVIHGFEEGFIPGDYEATHWSDSETFLAKVAESGGFALENVRELGHMRRDQWRQAVVRKPG
ncbi:MAG: methyltransferase domain-containing protein [Gammaproteobacteria bacterium]